MNSSLARFVAVATLFLLLFALPSCDCDDDDDNSSTPAPDDDDSSPADDDDNDDSTPDDDDDDDDSTPVDDDDDNDDDTPFDYPPDEGEWFGDVFIQQVDCGIPGDFGTSIAVGPDDTVYVVANKGGILFLYKKAPYEEKWTREKIDYFGDYADVAVDQNGGVHVAYADVWDSFFRRLKYAYSNGQGWDIIVLDEDGQRVGEVPAIDTDQSNHAHIIYGDYEGGSIRYATNASGDWEIEYVVTAVPRDYGGGNDVVVDADGFVHFTSLENNMFDPYLVYGNNRTGAWVADVIDSGSFSASLTVDSNGFAHIAYQDIGAFPYFGDVLKYTNNVNGFWFTITVDNENYQSGFLPSIDFDDQGFLHIAYIYDVNGAFQLSHATNESGSWVYERVEEADSEAFFPSMALDSTGNIFVVYEGYRDDRLRVSSFTEDESWKTESVDGGRNCRYADIALTSDGVPSISYMKSFDYSREVIFAQIENGQWTRSTVANEGGDDISLYLSPDDSAHISHVDWINSDDESLLYTSNQSGEWVTEELDISDFIGSTSLSIDDEGYLHIGYASDCAKYIHNDSGSWVGECIALEGGGFGGFSFDSNGAMHTSFLTLPVFYATNLTGNWEVTMIDDVNAFETGFDLDSNDNAHVGYYENNTFNLKYATNESGAWEKETIRFGHSISRTCDLAVDDSDRIHVLQSGIYLMKDNDGWSESRVFPDYACYFVVESDSWVHAICYSSGLFYVKFPAGYTGGKEQ